MVQRAKEYNWPDFIKDRINMPRSKGREWVGKSPIGNMQDPSDGERDSKCFNSPPHVRAIPSITSLIIRHTLPRLLDHLLKSASWTMDPYGEASLIGIAIALPIRGIVALLSCLYARLLYDCSILL